METGVAEIADRIYRLSTFVPDAAPGGFTFNQFLLDADEPMLFHCGMRALFPAVRSAAERILPLGRLRWISFSHVEADECGSLDQWLDAAPDATVVHGQLGCMLSVSDLSARPPRGMEDGAVLDLGGRRLRLVQTPHVPHNWESIAWHEEVTGTLLCGDIVTSAGNGPACVSTDIVGPALQAEQLFGAWSGGPDALPTLQRLATLAPRTLAAMHGSAYQGDGGRALTGLAAGLGELFRKRGEAR